MTTALLEVGGRTKRNGRRGGSRGRERGYGKIARKARNLGESWRGERGGPEPSFEDGKRNNLNIKGQSLVIL